MPLTNGDKLACASDLYSNLGRVAVVTELARAKKNSTLVSCYRRSWRGIVLALLIEHEVNT